MRRLPILFGLLATGLTVGLAPSAAAAQKLPSFSAVASYKIGSGPIAMAAGDVNGDGRPDLVTADYGADGVSLLLNKGDGAFQAARAYDTGPTPFAVAPQAFRIASAVSRRKQTFNWAACS